MGKRRRKVDESCGEELDGDERGVGGEAEELMNCIFSDHTDYKFLTSKFRGGGA